MEHTFSTPVALVRLSYLVGSIYAEVCTEHGLTVPQAQLMCVVRDQPRGMGEISTLLRVDKSSVTGLVERIERRGYARREMKAADRRAVDVSLTDDGKSVTDAFYDTVSQRMDDLFADIPARDQERFNRIATRVVLAEEVPEVFGDVAS